MLVTKTRSEVIPIYGGNWGYGYNNRTHALFLPKLPDIPPDTGKICGVYGKGLPEPNMSFDNLETITYDNKGFNHPNPCNHTATMRNCVVARDLLSGQVPEWDYKWQSTWPWVVDIYSNSDIRWVPNVPGQLGQFQAIGSQPDPSLTVTQKVAELEAGLVDEVFNIPRAIIELKDIPQTLRGIFNILSAMRRISMMGKSSPLYQFGSLDQTTGFAFSSKAFRDARDQFGSSNVRSSKEFQAAAANLMSASKGSLADVASAYLTYQFGIKPTAKDVQSFLGLKWSKDGGRTTALEFTKQHIEYKKGQKLRRPFNLGPRRNELPSVSNVEAELVTPILRDWHGPFGGHGLIKSTMQAVPACIAHSVRGVVFGEVLFDKVVDIPYSERLAYSGGLISTLYEVTPWTFVVDWVWDVGKFLQNMEKASFPVEYRPVLKFGPWVSLATSRSAYIPVFDSITWQVTEHVSPDPNSGYGGDVIESVTIGAPKWIKAFEYDLVYNRYPVVSAFNTIKPPPLRAPGRYSYGPAAALLVNYASGNKATFRR